MGPVSAIAVWLSGPAETQQTGSSSSNRAAHRVQRGRVEHGHPPGQFADHETAAVGAVVDPAD